MSMIINLSDLLKSRTQKQFEPFLGKTVPELKAELGIYSSAKHLNKMLVDRMLGSDFIEQLRLFNFEIKTVRVENDDVKESMSFPAFRCKDVVSQTWNTSDFRKFLLNTTFILCIFRKNYEGEFVFDNIIFWKTPRSDLKEVKSVWERTAKCIQLSSSNSIHFPKIKENSVCHVRPHGRNKLDKDFSKVELGITKRCFWFNSDYISNVIKAEELKAFSDDYAA